MGFRFWLSLLLVFFTSSLSGATLKIGVEDVTYYPVMDFSSSDHQGLMKAIVERFADADSVTFEYVALPIARFSVWFDIREIDLRLPDNPRWNSNDPSLIYSDPVVTLCQSTVVLEKNRREPVSQISKIGLLQGFTPSQHWSEAIANNQVAVVSDNSIGVLTRMLNSGMVDALDLHISTVKYQAEVLGLDPNQFVQSETVPAIPLSYRLSTKNQSDLIERFNHFLRRERTMLKALARSYNVEEGC